MSTPIPSISPLPQIPSDKIKIYFPSPKKAGFSEIPASLPFQVNQVAHQEGLVRIGLSFSDHKRSLLKAFIDPDAPDELILSRVPSPVGFSEPMEVTFEVNESPKRLVMREKEGKIVLKV